MSQPDLAKFILRGLALKYEGFENVDAVPNPAVDGILLMNSKVSTEFDKVTRVIDRPFFTNDPFSVANRRAIIEGDFEFFPPSAPGAAGPTGTPHCDVLFQCSGMKMTKSVGSSTKYTPISDGVPSATGYWWHTDTHVRATGSRNDISSLKLEIGNRASGKVKVQGNYNVVLKNALPVINLYSDVPPVSTYKNSRAYITAPSADSPVPGTELLVWAKSLEVVFGNKLGSKEYTSIKRQAISDRKATWNMRVAKTDLADFNPWTIRDTNQIITASYRHYDSDVGSVSPNLYTELGIRGQIDTIQEVDIDGDLGWDLSGPCIASNAGGDEFYIEFGVDTSPVTFDVFGPTTLDLEETVAASANWYADGGVAPYTWTVDVGSPDPLPSSLVLNAGTGALSGSPDVGMTGNYDVRLKVTDSTPGTPLTATYNVGIVITA